MASLTESDITFTPSSGGTRVNGKLRTITGTMTLGNGVKTYPSGGITITPSTFRMLKKLDALAVLGPGSRGIVYAYSSTNKKLQGFVTSKDTPFLVVEEVQSFTAAGVCDPLSYTPAYIVAIHDNSDNLYDVVPSTATPLANQAAVAHTTGVITLGGITAVGTVKVTYIPADDTGLWDMGNISREESLVINASNEVILSAVAIQNVYDNTGSVILTPTRNGAVVGDAEWAITDSAQGITRLRFNNARQGNTVKVTYVKAVGLDVSIFPYVADASISLTSEAINFLGTTGYKGLAVPTYGTRVVGLDGAAGEHSIRLGGPSLTAANGKARWDPQLNKITANETTDVTSLRMPLLLQDSDLRSISTTRELRVTEAPTSSTVDVIAVGW